MDQSVGTFELQKQSGQARAGRLLTHRGWIETPVFMPVGTKASGRRVWALGTTVARTLESQARGLLQEQPDGSFTGATKLFIYPPFEFKVVDALLTNFHLPKSTLLMLAAAFASRETILAAYRHAIEARYRFYSYGDCMLMR